jgi:hypothetical protein
LLSRLALDQLRGDPIRIDALHHVPHQPALEPDGRRC